MSRDSGLGIRDSVITDALARATAPCITSSFQAECMVLTHMLLESTPQIPVLFLDTVHHFAETYKYRDEMAAAWKMNLVTLRAAEPKPGLWQTSTEQCCALHKVGPLFSALERYDEAIDALTRAQQLDPLAHRSGLAATLLRAGRYDEAVRAASLVIDLDPHYSMGHATLGWAHLKKGRYAKGLAELERAISLAPGNTLFVAQLGQACALVGKVEQARDVLGRLQELSRRRYVSPYHMAYVHTGLGESDRAMDALEQAYEERAGGVYGIKGSFLFTPLRSHPRFTALLRKMNLVS